MTIVGTLNNTGVRLFFSRQQDAETIFNKFEIAEPYATIALSTFPDDQLWYDNYDIPTITFDSFFEDENNSTVKQITNDSHQGERNTIDGSIPLQQNCKH